MKKRYVIIGVSAAGLGAAVKLRSLDTESEIVCLTAESEMPYNRCLLADYLAGSKELAAIHTKKEDFFAENNIELMLNAYVTKLDRDNKNIVLGDGRTVSYDALLIGTGRSVVLPKLAGIDSLGVYPFYNLGDVTKILSFVRARNVEHVTVVGAGLSGLECADALVSQGICVDIVERENNVLARQIDLNGSQFLVQRAAQHGVNVTLSASVEKILSTKEKFVRAVQLTSGQLIKTDMVIFAIGGRPNSDFALKAGIVMHEHGILTSPTMQTNDTAIFAAGDVCVVNDLLTQKPVQTCLWTDSVMQGMAAAYGMTGQNKIYPGTLIVSSSHIFGTTFVTAGPVSQQDHGYEEIVRQGHDFYHKYLRDQHLVLKGFVMIGRVNQVGALRKKLLDSTPFELEEMTN